jgi:hypothetical protein
VNVVLSANGGRKANLYRALALALLGSKSLTAAPQGRDRALSERVPSLYRPDPWVAELCAEQRAESKLGERLRAHERLRG